MAEQVMSGGSETPVSSGSSAAGTSVVSSGGVSSGGSAARQEEDWRDRRIAKLTATNYDKDSRIRELEAEIAKRAAPSTATSGTSTPANPEQIQAEIDRKATSLAAEIAVAREFNANCNEMAEKGREAFSDFDEKFADGVVSHVDRRNANEVNAYNSMLAAAYKTGKGAEVLYALASDKNYAAKVLGMAPIDMAMELKELALKGSPIQADKREVTRVGKPVTPVGNRGQQHEPIDPSDPIKAATLSSAEWHARRAAQVAEQEKKKRG